MSRREFLLMAPIMPFGKTSSPKFKAVPVSERALPLESGAMYVYRNDRFQALYMVSDFAPDGCVAVRRRVDWYDSVSKEEKSVNESVIYLTGADEF